MIARQRLREQGVPGSERTARPSAGPQVNARACNLTVRRRRPKLTPAPITMWPLSAASPPPRVFLHAGCLACAPHVTGGDGWHRNSSLAPSSQFSVTSQKQASEKGGAAESADNRLSISAAASPPAPSSSSSSALTNSRGCCWKKSFHMCETVWESQNSGFVPQTFSLGFFISKDTASINQLSRFSVRHCSG